MRARRRRSRDGQARALLEAPSENTLKGKRDRAILATFLHHGLRCEELCGLRVRDLQSRQGVPHLRIFGKGAKVRYVPAHPLALERIHDYLQAAGHGQAADLAQSAGMAGARQRVDHPPLRPAPLPARG
jgi:site-specific recombinase XerD